MSHNTPFCPKCGRKMERIFRSNSETPRLFVCRECGHEQRRYGEPWSLKDIQSGIYTELLKIRVMLEKAIPDSSPQTSAQHQSPSCSEAPGSADRKDGAASQEPTPCHKFMCEVGFLVGGTFYYASHDEMFTLRDALEKKLASILPRVAVSGLEFKELALIPTADSQDAGSTQIHDRTEGDSFSEVPSSSCCNPPGERPTPSSEPQIPDE